MESSRIFIKGLPPTISEEDFKNHFSAKSAITDAKLIPHRRIGYIGYKSPEDAAKAVKYFNKSFIRMSKIGVELARPISDATLPISRKAQREQDRENAKIFQAQRESREAASKEKLNAATKRKRSDVDEEDPKLKEFLEVMQPASKAKKWATEVENDVTDEPPLKIQAIEVPEAESDDEYESVPKKSRKSSPPRPPAPVPAPIQAVVEAPAEDEPMVDISAIDATDDDWLRSRTNRVLDLMDPEDIAPAQSSKNNVEVVKAINAPIIDEEPEEQFEGFEDEQETPKPDLVRDAIAANGRLFVRNLPYTATEEDLRKHFEPYGSLEEVHLPVDASGTSKGFVLVQYTDPATAAEAYHNLDGEPFQGRLLHILSAAAKRENKLDEFAIAKLPLKKQKQIKKKAEASSATFNWNSLFMNQDAVNSTIAARLGVSKSELLDPTSADAGVKQAIAETTVIQESKSYFAKNGVDLEAFKKRERGDTSILVKNFPFGMTLEELRKMFEEFGQVLRVLMPPTGTIAIVEFAQPSHARAAFGSLAYRRMKDSILYLEKAPKDLFTVVSSNAEVVSSDRKTDAGDQKLSGSDLLEKDDTEGLDTSTLFVRNLNFTTTSDRLTETFKPLDGFMSARVNTKTDAKKPGQVLSMGFGFLEFKSKAQAQAALKAMDGYMLEGHKLLIKASHKGADAAEDRRKEDRARKMAGKRTKIIIKNLPFEATKKDVRTLFSSYGQLRSVRVPKKFDHSTRGFAFADFITAREAENALEALKDTHLLGRRLVIEFASGDALDAEEEIEKMQKKVSGQVNKVALQNLTGGGRKKFNIDGNDGEED
ncbi:Multiple RNA-binding domain-containing protein [Lachnellula hyalina]|uniref:Multiple RNA-binding domain-containing protein 1 n=1 Tax=Lachnellula hyalina TaxID=1316788 RepID=A0A8H8R3D6_9HELO|nr:Multiple RNA-binding domain-containing protein [Lachnellula hyalina]TVY26745.1 Multiple RNA-binding domain-containing protein [Lachnellula hyalina]